VVKSGEDGWERSHFEFVAMEEEGEDLASENERLRQELDKHRRVIVKLERERDNAKVVHPRTGILRKSWADADTYVVTAELCRTLAA
jgi:hypothetical protein